METKHTKGTWEVHFKMKGVSQNRTIHISSTIRNENQPTVKEVVEICKMTSANPIDAKLMAAAPEMLEVLQKFKKQFEEKGRAKDTDFYYIFCEAVQKATE